MIELFMTIKDLSYDEIRSLVLENTTTRKKLIINNCTVESEATAGPSVGSGEDTYLTYYYRAKNEDDGSILEYLFAWMTPFNEAHRGWGDHKREWYDDFKEGVKFKIKYDPHTPENHCIEAQAFKGLELSAVYITKM